MQVTSRGISFEVISPFFDVNRGETGNLYQGVPLTYRKSRRVYSRARAGILHAVRVLDDMGGVTAGIFDGIREIELIYEPDPETMGAYHTQPAPEVRGGKVDRDRREWSVYDADARVHHARRSRLKRMHARVVHRITLNAAYPEALYHWTRTSEAFSETFASYVMEPEKLSPLALERLRRTLYKSQISKGKLLRKINPGTAGES